MSVIQNESFIIRNLTNEAELRQKIEFQAQRLKTIKIKGSNSFNYKSKKIKMQYECRADSKKVCFKVQDFKFIDFHGSLLFFSNTFLL